MTDAGSNGGPSASEQVDGRIAELGDWRGETLRRMRQLIKEADHDVVEEWKWAKATSPGTPVWSHDGIVCTGESYKSVVKLTFAKGASLEDPDRLFNASLEGNTRRAIDIHEGENVDAGAFKALIRAAVALNASRVKAKPAPRIAGKLSEGEARGRGWGIGSPSFSQGQPADPKGDGDAPVRRTSRVPGWSVHRRNAWTRSSHARCPTLQAVRWISPFYGIRGKGWLLSFKSSLAT